MGRPLRQAGAGTPGFDGAGLFVGGMSSVGFSLQPLPVCGYTAEHLDDSACGWGQSARCRPP
jgi:hypothetical protein